MSATDKHIQEVNRHGAIERQKKGAASDAVTERLIKVRELMQKDSKLSFDQAFTAVCQKEIKPVLEIPAKLKVATKIAPVADKKAKPKLVLMYGGTAICEYRQSGK